LLRDTARLLAGYCFQEMGGTGRMARAIIVNLPPDEYRRLAARAEASDRDPHQEARHLIRAALVDLATPADAAPAGADRSAIRAGGQTPALV